MPDSVDTQRVGFTFIWKIENFSLLPKLIKEGRIEISVFTADNLNKTCWTLKLFFGRCYDSNQDAFRFHLDRISPWGPNYISLDYELSILSNGDSKEKSVMVNGYQYQNSNFQPFSTPLRITPHEIFGKREILPGDTLTLQCKMWHHKTLCLEPGFCLARSRINAERKSFTWTIDKFSTLQINDEKSVSVELRRNLNLSFKITLYLTGIPTYDEKIRINVRGINDEKVDFITVLGISVQNVKGKAVYHSEDEFQLSKGIEEWRFPLILDKKQFISNKDLLLPDDKLSLKCLLIVSKKNQVLNEIECNTYGADAAVDLEAALTRTIEIPCVGKEVHSSSNSLTKDLRYLFEEKQHADVILRVHSEEFSVHKVILAARSSVFKTMFDTDMKEKFTNTIEIDDFEPDIIRRLLLYIYSDTLDSDIQWENAPSLYLAADKYAVLGLKEKCSSYLMANLSVSNLYEIFLLADMLKDKDLKDFVLSFIQDKGETVLNSDEWKHFAQKHPEMTIDILTCLYKNVVKQF